MGNIVGVFFALVARGFGYHTAFQLLAAHISHVQGWPLQYARGELSQALTRHDLSKRS